MVNDKVKSTVEMKTDIGEWKLPRNYFDHQAAKPMDPRVIEAMMPYWTEKIGNASSLHAVGDEATNILEQSRKSIAELVNAAEKDEIVFTSGATESNNLAFLGYAFRNKNKGNHIIISEVEHISIQNLAKYLEKYGFNVSRVPVDQYGRVKVEKIRSKITDETIMISVQHASNEIGTIQPISQIGEIARAKNIGFHVDAVATEGLVPIDVQMLKIDLLTLSSNDIYGPKGVGALYARKGVKLQPIFIGGGQERGLRSGSENIPGIVGMAQAAEIAKEELPEESSRLRRYRDYIIKSVLESVPQSYLNGHPTERTPNNAHFRFEAIEGESILLSFKDKGISIATGSACSSKTLEPSHTLLATGLLHEEAHGSLEITLGRFNFKEEIDTLLENLPPIIARLRELSPLYKTSKNSC